MSKLSQIFSKAKNFRHRCRNVAAGALLLGGTIGGTAAGVAYFEKQRETGKILRSYSMTEAFRYGFCNSISDYVAKADYAVDTIKVTRAMLNNGKNVDSLEQNAAGKQNRVFITYGIYKRRNNKMQVILNHFAPDTVSESNLTPQMKQRIVRFAKGSNDKIRRQMTLAHEFHHQACFPDRSVQKKIADLVGNKFIFDYAVSPEQDAKLCFHNEICSDINGLLMLREMYLQNRDTSMLERYFPPYGKAVSSGQLRPGSRFKQDKSKERLFIAKYLTERWKKEKTHYYEKYAENQLGILINHGKYKGNRAWNEYDKALNFAYTFIMDGELVNMNYISRGEVEDVRISDSLMKKINKVLADKEKADAQAMIAAAQNQKQY